MKSLTYSFPIFLFLLLPACTKKAMTEFEWKGLANGEITAVKLEEKQLLAQDSESLLGRAESGLVIRVVERKGGAKNFGGLFERIEFLLNSIYQDHQAPYPGQVTKIITCPESLRPKPLPEKEDAEAKRKGFLLTANDREVFGDCDASKVHFHSAYFLIGCKRDDVAYEVKLFLRAGEKTMDELTRLYERFTCI